MSDPTTDDRLKALEAAQAFRQAISEHAFTKNEARILDLLIDFWLCHGAKPKGALLPGDWVFCRLCCPDKKTVSVTLSTLIGAQVLEKEIYHGQWRRPGAFYRLRPPTFWRVSRIRGVSQADQELRTWLQALYPAGQELLPEPPSLTKALIDGFLEVAGSGRCSGDNPPLETEPVIESRARPFPMAGSDAPICPVSSNPVESKSSQLAKHQPVGETPTNSLAKRQLMVGKTPTSWRNTNQLVGETPTDGWQNTNQLAKHQPTRSDRSDRLIESTSDFDLDSNRSPARARATDDQAYAEGLLFEAIGQHERNGPSAAFWARAIREKPNGVAKICSVLKMLQREGRGPARVGAWMRRSVGNLF